MRVLLVEDDAPLRSLVQRGLTEDGHVVDALADGTACTDYLSSAQYDALILDLNLPHEDGLSILRRLRSANDLTPVLILTGRDGVDDVVSGLDAGADDYLRKPFAFTELEARLRSLSRRPLNWSGTILHVADLSFDCATRQARRGDRDLELTAKEGSFLELLMRNAGRTVTRRSLEDQLWDRDTARESNVLDVYARRLRVKLSAAGEPPLLHTMRGVGYKIESAQ